ncbi:MAG: type I polyketide synthase [Candidatus Hinthialibacter antarcticus]|nr:type I polyketide synthase [Candidatus Hinthialibacter antarcticus]
MNDALNQPGDHAQRLKRAVQVIQDLRVQLDEAKQPKFAPIAVVGAGCRLPGGVDSLRSYWQLLCDGVDAITEVPEDRWSSDDWYDPSPDAPGKTYVRNGGFLKNIDAFDPEFFGISPREAASMDPQQRLLLETAWEAVERAGIAPSQLQESQTGVFIGISGADYTQLMLDRDPAQYDLYMGSGAAHSVAAGRLSYFLGLHGPCVAIDTACSSSLTAIHLACQSLRSRECSVALAGGVNVILTPSVSINHSRAKMLAPDGRCKTFDESADGFSRAEGCGVIALKRLDDALADGDSILAVVRGSAVNQDGKTSGITVPNGLAQEQVIRRALVDAGVGPGDVDYVEAHGTGTSLGDPIEVEALAAAYGAGRASDQPLRIASVKSNIGHAETAAGVAGFIKAALCLHKRQLPASLHIKTLNSLVDWDNIPVRPVTQLEEWNSTRTLRLAGVSSFGFGGSNAHIILEEAPPAVAPESLFPSQQNVFALSAKNDNALSELLKNYLDRFEREPGLSLNDVCYTANAGRAHWNNRVAIIASSLPELQRELQNTLDETQFAHTNKPPEIAFLFTGQGSQYPGMGRGLFETCPVFREELTRCDAILQPILGQSIVDVLYKNAGGDGAIHQTAFTQPALYALEYSLAKLWMSWGAAPSALMGHSVGEYAAAAVAGVFSLEDGAALIAKRARLMQSLPQDGGMVAVLDDRALVDDLIRPYGDGLSCAAFNGPRNTVISGKQDAIEKVIAELKKRKIRHQALTVSHAFHSSCMEPMLDAFEAFAETVEFHPPQIELISNRSGAIAGDEIACARYWRDHIRNPVEFSLGMETLADMGVGVFLEAGPKPVLCGMGRYCVAGPSVDWLPSLNEGIDDWDALLPSVAQLYRQGAAIDWAALYRPFRGRVVDLPTYPFQRQSYWAPEKGYKPGARLAASSPIHSLLHRRIDCAAHDNEWLFETDVSLAAFPYLRDHAVFGEWVLPAAFYLETARAGLHQALPDQTLQLSSIQFHQPCILEEDQSATLQLIITKDKDGDFSFQLFGRDQTNNEWLRLVSGGAVAQSAVLQNEIDFDAVRERVPIAIDVSRLYQGYQEHGVEFGDAFQRIKELWTGGDECLAQLDFPDAMRGAHGDCIHPALLDACAQTFGGLFIDDTDASLFLQVGIKDYVVVNNAQPKWCYLKRNDDTDNERSHHADMVLFDENKQAIALIDGMRVQKADQSTRSPFSADDYYSIVWRPQPFIGSNAALMAPKEIAASILPKLQGAVRSDELQRYGDLLQGLDRLACLYIQNALCEAMPANQRFSFVELKAALRVLPSFEILLRRWLYWLEQHRIVKRDGDGWAVAPSADAKACESLHEQLLAQHPNGWAELGLMKRCAAQIGPILQDSLNAVDVIFAQDKRNETETIYRDSPGARLMNNQLKHALEALLSTRPDGRVLRILEIGAGTGGATSYILPALPADGVEYTFTDLSPHFLAKAKESFKQYGFLQYKTLDIEADPAAQGFDAQSYDVVIAFNVLHATRDLKQTVLHAKQLMAPGGLMLLLENTAPMAWVEMIWGLTEGWWRFDDRDLRTEHPLLDEPQWMHLLQEAGFEETESVSPANVDRRDLFKQSILIARNPQTAPDDVWLLFCDENSEPKALQQELKLASQKYITVYAAKQYKKIREDEFALNPHDASGYSKLINELTLPDDATVRCVYLWGFGLIAQQYPHGAGLAQSCASASMGFIHLLCELDRQSISASVCVVTSGAQRVDETEPAPGFAQSVLWGFGKNALLEFSDRAIRLLDLPSPPGAADWRTALRQLQCEDREDHVALRGAQRYVARIERAQKSQSVMPPVASDGAYLITGGLGALGLSTAQWLINQGAKQLVLLGRRGATSDEAMQSVEGWSDAGVDVQIEKIDVADAQSLRGLIHRLDGGPVVVRGVFHAAGVAGYKPLRELAAQDIEAQFAAKVAGAWNLHCALQDRPLDFFVMFSSMVSLWGANGQGHYVAANHFLDGLANHRRALGLPGLSVNWGPITGGGMFPDEIVDELKRMGIQTTGKDQTIPAISALMQRAPSSIAPAKIDWRRFLGVYEARRQRRLFDEMRTGLRSKDAVVQQTKQSLVQVIGDAPETLRRDLMAGHLQSALANVLCLDASRTINAEQGFFDIGMDSLTAMELKNQLEKDLQTTLSSTLAFDYSTIETLTDYLLNEITAPPEHEPEAPTQAQPDVGASSEAIKAMSEEEAEQLLLKKLESL